MCLSYAQKRGGRPALSSFLPLPSPQFPFWNDFFFFFLSAVRKTGLPWAHPRKVASECPPRKDRKKRLQPWLNESPPS